MEIELIRELARAESIIKGTTLITLYIPTGGNL